MTIKIAVVTDKKHDARTPVDDFIHSVLTRTETEPTISQVQACSKRALARPRTMDKFMEPLCTTEELSCWLVDSDTRDPRCLQPMREADSLLMCFDLYTPMQPIEEFFAHLSAKFPGWQQKNIIILVTAQTPDSQPSAPTHVDLPAVFLPPSRKNIAKNINIDLHVLLDYAQSINCKAIIDMTGVNVYRIYGQNMLPFQYRLLAMMSSWPNKVQGDAASSDVSYFVGDDLGAVQEERDTSHGWAMSPSRQLHTPSPPSSPPSSPRSIPEPSPFSKNYVCTVCRRNDVAIPTAECGHTYFCVECMQRQTSIPKCPQC